MQITDYTFANITARPFLTLNDASNKWIFTDKTKHVIDVCMYREPEVIELIESKGATFDWFPTDERPMDVEAILSAVQKLCQYDRDGSHIIVHCLHGNNRSRTVVEAFYFAKYCKHFEDEYKGYTNHLIWNCEQGYLPPLPEMEHLLRRYTPRPYSVETFDEIEGISISGITPLSEEEWRVFNEFDKEFPGKTVSELLKLTFEKTGRYAFDEEERKRYGI